MSSAYDCQTCGACCNSPWTGAGYVRLQAEDLERLRGLELPIITQTEGGEGWQEESSKLGTKLDDRGRRMCVAFEGGIGERCACGVYEQRPRPCRQYQAGDVPCLEARRRHGLPV